MHCTSIELEQVICREAEKYVAIELMLHADKNEFETPPTDDEKNSLLKHRLSKETVKYEIYPKVLRSIQPNANR